MNLKPSNRLALKDQKMSTNYAYISTGNNALRLSKTKEDSPKEKTQQRKQRERFKEEEEVSSDGNVNTPAKRKKNRLRRRC